MSEVKATGMHENVPGCVLRIFISSAHFFPDTCYILAQAETPLVHL